MIRIRLYRVYLNKGGYDRTGQYWGIGAPLYCYEWEDNNRTCHSFHLRRWSRQEAIELVYHWLTTRNNLTDGSFTFYGPWKKPNPIQENLRMLRQV